MPAADLAPAHATTLRRYVGGLLVNLLIGIPTVAAVVCARWYAAHGHCSYGDLGQPDLDYCSYDQIESSGFVRFGLILFGALVLLLILVFDVLRPLSKERPLTPRLLTLPAVLVPYALLLAAAKTG
jgi:hypothetical protein